MELRPRSAHKRGREANQGSESGTDDGGGSDVNEVVGRVRGHEGDHQEIDADSEESEGDSEKSGGDSVYADADEGDDDSYHTSRSSSHSATDTNFISSSSADECTAPPPNRTSFKSWIEFEDYLQVYSAATFQSFRVRSNCKVEERNKKIRENDNGKPLIPEEWGYYTKTLVCTHAGKFKSRSQGKRPRQETRSIDCKAKINLCVRPAGKEASSFVLCISKTDLQHNHRLDRRTYEQYAAVRTAIPKAVEDSVNMLRKAGAKKKSIHQHILERCDKQITIRDVHNLVRKLKKRDNGSTTSTERMKAWMKEFCEEAGNVGRVFIEKKDEKKTAVCITLQTAHMREVFHRFPEAMFIDATHGTNASKYKNERAPTLLTAIEEFKTNNNSWQKLQCVIIDKDFTEIAVLREALPDVRILLCHFHVIKYLREEVAVASYGLSPWQRSQLRSLFPLLVGAQTESSFTRHRLYMSRILTIGERQNTHGQHSLMSSDGLVGRQIGSDGLVGRQMGSDGLIGLQMGSDGLVGREVVFDDNEVGAHLHPFEVYFRKNWDSCKPMWCSYKRQNAVTLGNNTNNRLESSWKQLKYTMDPFMEVDESIVSIMCFQTRCEHKFTARVNKISVVHNVGYDREMQLVANLVSEHACRLIYDQYVYAIGALARYSFDEAVPGIYFIHNETRDENALDEPNAEYSVNKQNWECSCLFMSTRLLPCRHVFFIRKQLGMEVVIPTQLIPSRWLLSSLRSDSTLDTVPGAAFKVGKVLKGKKAPWDANRKFREAHLVATTISDMMSGMGMPQYKAALKALQGVAQLFKRGECENVASMISDRTSLTSDGGSDITSERVLLTVVQPPPSEDESTSTRQHGCHDGSGGSAHDSEEVGDVPFMVHHDRSGVVGDTSYSAASDTQLTLDLRANPSPEIPLAQEFSSFELDHHNTPPSLTDIQLSNPPSVSQMGTELGQMGTELGQMGTELGQMGQMGTDLGQMGTELGQMGTELGQMGTELGQMGTEHAELRETAQSDCRPQVASIRPAQTDEDFEIESPPRSRGRPKAKPKAVKAKRNRSVAMAEEDSDMHHMNLTVASIGECLRENPSYDAAAETLRKFKLYLFDKKGKPPKAYEHTKLPASKQLIRANEFVRVFDMTVLRKCDTQVSTLQRAVQGLAEQDVVVDIPSIGAFSTETLGIMKSYHRAIGAVGLVDIAIKWLTTIDFASLNTDYYLTTEDPEMCAKLRQINLLSSDDIEVLDLAAKGRLSDTTVKTMMTKLFRSNSNVIAGSPHLIIVNALKYGPNKTEVIIDNKSILSLLFGASKQRVVIPVNVSNNHWCAIMIDLDCKCLFYYDPMSSTYKLDLRAIGQKIASEILRWKPSDYSCREYASTIGTQSDSYNCGIFILLTFEIFIGAPSLKDVTKKALQYLRYRYLQMCL